ncbi:MAG: hypothetical protein ACK4GT_04130 [Pararhodobacter sp.]
MSWVVQDTPVQARGYRVAALAKGGVEAKITARGAAGYGRKAPVAILLAGPGGVSAFAPTGEALSRDEVEALAPGAWARFAEQNAATD